MEHITFKDEFKKIQSGFLTSILYPIIFTAICILFCKLAKFDNISEFQTPKIIQVASAMYMLASFIFIYKWADFQSDKNMQNKSIDEFTLFKFNINNINKGITLFGSILLGMIVSTIMANFLTGENNSNLYFSFIGVILIQFIVYLYKLTDRRYNHWKVFRAILSIILFVLMCNLAESLVFLQIMSISVLEYIDKIEYPAIKFFICLIIFIFICKSTSLFK